MFVVTSGKLVFNENICDKRWTLMYNILQNNSKAFFYFNWIFQTSSKNCRLSQHEKFHKAHLLTSELASVASEKSRVHFQQQLEVLEDFITHWKAGNEVTITDVDEGIYVYTLSYQYFGHKRFSLILQMIVKVEMMMIWKFLRIKAMILLISLDLTVYVILRLSRPQSNVKIL